MLINVLCYKNNIFKIIIKYNLLILQIVRKHISLNQ